MKPRKEAEARLREELRVLAEADAIKEKNEASLRRSPFMVEVHLRYAHGLRAADKNGMSDPYVVAMLGKVKRKSKVVKKTLEPVWDEVLTLDGVDEDVLRGSKLRLKCYDMDLAVLGRSAMSDDLGFVDVSLEPLLAKPSVDFRQTLSTQGELIFTVTLVRQDALLPSAVGGANVTAKASEPGSEPASERASEPASKQAAAAAGTSSAAACPNETGVGKIKLPPPSKLPPPEGSKRVVTSTQSWAPHKGLGPIDMHMHAHACTCMHMHAHACRTGPLTKDSDTYTCTCMYMHTHACTCMHMHARACTCMQSWAPHEGLGRLLSLATPLLSVTSYIIPLAISLATPLLSVTSTSTSPCFDPHGGKSRCI